MRARALARSCGPRGDALSAVADVIIAGAGIGGLTTAIALARTGIRVRVLERASELRTAGAGLALQPNAVAALTELGLGPAIIAAGSALSRAAILNRSGRRLGPETRFSRIFNDPTARTVAVHRARLHEVLLDAVGEGVVRMGVRITGFEQGTDGVTAVCGSGERIGTELLIGADGVHSAVRAQLVGDGPPRYAGYTSWRGITPPGQVRPPDRVTETWGHGERFGLVDIGFGEIYWFAVANAPPGGTDRDARAELLARFGGWHDPIRMVIDATPTDRIIRTDIVDREPITSWHEGRVALLGDAAHPMTPNLGQGAGQAIEDARSLAQCLAGRRSLEEALRAYETARVARANGFVLASRQFGAVSQWSHPVKAWTRDLAMRLTPERALIAQARKLLGASPHAAAR